MILLPSGRDPYTSSLVQALTDILTRISDRLTAVERRTVDAGLLSLVPSGRPLVSEVLADGSVLERDEYPLLFRAIGTDFNTGGETASQFRVPNLATPSAGTEWRISKGA